MSPPNLFVVEEIMVGDLASHIHRRDKTGQGPLTLQLVLALALDIIRGLVSEGREREREAWSCCCSLSAV